MMTMREIINNFPKHLGYKPAIQNESKLKRSFNRFIVSGMGGSNLAPPLIKILRPGINIESYRNYGLPLRIDSKKTLIICNSYSGNTEEVLDCFVECLKNKLKVAVISTGGKLLDLAKSNKVPYIQLPDVGLEPRFALGFSLLATLKILGEVELFEVASLVSNSLKSEKYEEGGQVLASKLKNFVPVFYSSSKNEGIVYNWKIRFNENVKIPAFYNVLPELNHNEMIGFLSKPNQFRDKFSCVLFKDSTDHPSIKRRMVILEEMLKSNAVSFCVLDLDNSGTVFKKIFSSLILADWTSYHLSREYGVDPLEVDLIEKFKERLKA